MATGNGADGAIFIEYYNGSSWRLVPVPQPKSGGALSSVSCVASSSCVAVGSKNTGYDTTGTLVEDFNGSNWYIVQSPNPGGGGSLSSVSCPTTTFCMAVGTGNGVYSLAEEGAPPAPGAPGVTSLSPDTGSATGGTVVTIEGNDLTGTTSVEFGTKPALSFHVVSYSEITATAPAELSGTVPVIVATPNGKTATTPNCSNSFSYGTSPPPPTSGSYIPIPPFRVADTRPSSGEPYAGDTLQECSTLNIQITGLSGSNVPSSGVSAIVANVTAVGQSQSGYLTVYPAYSIRPVVSNLNFSSGETIANLVEAPVSSTGQIAVYNGSAGSTNVVVDVEGYVSSTGASYTPITPLRVCDTRAGDPSGLSGQQAQCNGHSLSPGTPLIIAMTGTGLLPISATAAVVNLTVVGSQGNGYLTAYPSSSSTPTTASNVNFTKGEVISNRAIVELSSTGEIDLVSNTTTNVVVDVSGYYGAGGSTYTSLSPRRIADSRCSSSSPPAFCASENIPSENLSFFPLGRGSTENLTVAGIGSIPLTATAVVLNVTVASTTKGSYLTIYPSDTSRPTASDLNWSAGTTIPNLVVAEVGSNGQVSIYNNAGSVDVIADVEGWYG